MMNTHAGAPPPSAPDAPGLPLNTVLMFPLPHPLKLWGLRRKSGRFRLRCGGTWPVQCHGSGYNRGYMTTEPPNATRKINHLGRRFESSLPPTFTCLIEHIGAGD